MLVLHTAIAVPSKSGQNRNERHTVLSCPQNRRPLKVGSKLIYYDAFHILATIAVPSKSGQNRNPLGQLNATPPIAVPSKSGQNQ